MPERNRSPHTEWFASFHMRQPTFPSAHPSTRRTSAVPRPPKPPFSKNGRTCPSSSNRTNRSLSWPSFERSFADNRGGRTAGPSLYDSRSVYRIFDPRRMRSPWRLACCSKKQTQRLRRTVELLTDGELSLAAKPCSPYGGRARGALAGSDVREALFTVVGVARQQKGRRAAGSRAL